MSPSIVSCGQNDETDRWIGCRRQRAFWLLLATCVGLGNFASAVYGANIKVGPLSVELEQTFFAGRNASNNIRYPLIMESPDDGTDRFMVAEKFGRVRLIKNGLVSTFLDIESEVGMIYLTNPRENG